MPRKRRKLRPRERKPVFCGKCGRVTYTDQSDYEWWLVGTGNGSGVVRCPQHITEWTMRISGLGRGMQAYKFKRLAKEHDNYDPAMMAYEPLFLEEDLNY